MKRKYIEIVEEFEYKGYKCVIKRNLLLKALLGYIKLPKGHKYFGVPIDDISVECHWGLTYGEIEGDDYVIGFDCAHSFDFDIDTVDLEYILGVPNKDKNYVLENIKEIVDQLQRE